jgi:hypothetical protein
VTLTISARNDGPDAATLRVAAPVGAGLALQGFNPSAGTYSAASATWSLTLGSGAAETLTLATRAVTAGTATTIAEVADSTAQDGDSIPADDDPAQDDRTSVAVDVQGAPVPARAKVAADALALRLSPRRDRRLPFRFRAVATLTITRAVPRDACNGTVTITARAGSKKALTQRAPLRLSKASCAASARLTIRSRTRVGKARALKLTARFAGNAFLNAITSRAVTARLR